MNLRQQLETLALALSLFAAHQSGFAAEIARLTAENWNTFVPQGKEVDCIYGDFVLRNDELVVVIAQPIKGRNANMTVRNVGGMIIDMTRRSLQSDQLSCYYPGAAFVEFVSLAGAIAAIDGTSTDAAKIQHKQGKSISFECHSVTVAGRPKATNRYTLEDGKPYVVVETVYSNPHDDPISFEFFDSIRADRYFEFGNDVRTKMFWSSDDWFRQSYGVIADDRDIKRVANNRGAVLHLLKNDSTNVRLAKGETANIVRKIFAAENLVELLSIANDVLGLKSSMVSVTVSDPAGAVNDARLVVKQGNTTYGSARTSGNGQLNFGLPDGEYALSVEAIGRATRTISLSVPQSLEATIQLDACGYVAAKITDGKGLPIPCKVAFHGKGATKSPDFGPDGAATGVQNLIYSHNGEFRREIGPGQYDVIVSYGPEYDAWFTSITVERGQTAKLNGPLHRVVDTLGWVSSDFHSHSSPSGDNASSQLGRVLNLLCEHVEFAPCTEHNRIDSYTPHLKSLNIESLMATCSGMELTGSPLPINHQNSFPLVLRQRTQDGGGPVTDENPVVQIERLALWDSGSDKLVQQNHPDLLQMLADKDLDGKADGGFSKMFGFMDVVEVHPPEGIFSPPTRDASGKLSRNPIFHWMQMLNLGYRVPGVVNTDAHYTFHGSGWMRNYLQSKTDDPSKINTMDMVHAAEKGHLIMTTGPFLDVEVMAEGSGDHSRGGPGDTVVTASGKAELHVKVQCPNWFDVNRVQVFVNGRPDPRMNFTRRDTPTKFSDSVIKFEQSISLALDSDAHLIVAAIGEGLGLGEVFGAKQGTTPPVAVANPIFVDLDGKGFQANGDLLDLPLPIDKTEVPSKK